MGAVEITGLVRIRNPKANLGGSIVLAYFDCEARGLAFSGCALVRTKKNGLTVWPPKLDGPEANRRYVQITDCSLRHEMMLQARETYRALGGTDAEWIGRSVPLGPHPAEPVVSHYIPNDEADGRSDIVKVAVEKRRIEPDDGEDRAGLETFLSSNETADAQADGGE